MKAADVNVPRDTVDHAMVRMPEGCIRENYTAEVVEIIQQAGLEYLPVLDSFSSGRPIGIVSCKDLERKSSAAGQDGARIADASVLEVPQVRTGTLLEQVYEAPWRRGSF